jgi:hypothetical protein
MEIPTIDTIGVLSTINVIKTDNNNTNIKTDIVKDAPEVLSFKSAPAAGAMQNLPPCSPLEIYFKDLSFSVQKMFSKS